MDTGEWEATAWNVSSALALRSPTISQSPKRISYIDNENETELVGVDGVLIALRPALEKCQTSPGEHAWSRLLHASHQSVRNEAIAQVYKRIWGQQLQDEIGNNGGLFEYLARPNVSAYRFFN